MVEVHLIAGGTGSGKTTYARGLASKMRAIRFSIDEWMTTLFWMDSPQPIEFEWTMERIGRCEMQIREQVAALAERGLGSVLDLGFTRAAHRLAFADFARTIGAQPVLHYLNVPAETRWQRVLARNVERGDTYRMDVDKAMFEFMEGQWQAPDEGELQATNGHVFS
ncbi:AAA family ATPase [Sphingomonas sp. GCM10030256]|uniref:AAA family ATPase n=1 Tax=Sphingomonas sp. GCM10030256 TaxID=3273427 RepID=UPI003612CFE9